MLADAGQFPSARIQAVTGLCWLLALWLALPAARADEFDHFEKKIRPVLVERCYKCHSAQSEKLKGGLLLDTRAGLMKGGESGRPALVPRDAEKSLLIEAIRHQNEDLQMPPKEKLTEAQIADFTDWVNAGAPDPRTNTIQQIASPKAGLAQAKQFWSFVPPKDQPLPPVKAKGWPQSPIDHFILAKLEEKGLAPAAPADRRTWIRRATYDLTGLPPTLEEIDAFLRDTSGAAYQKVVDRLLASPRYGERWGRYWLDVARYSDTKGYVYDREEKRFVHSHVYRDWVIRALNDDLPYDQFLILQIAADKVTPDPATDEDRAALAAMGFLTVGRRFLGVTHDIIDDRIDVLTRGTMGLTVACARCHDHKFDPIPTKDYYSLYGVFHNTTEQTVPLRRKPEVTREYEEYAKELRNREEKLSKTFQEKREQTAARLRGQVAEYLVAVLDVAKLPSEEFYAILGPNDVNPMIVRQWEAFLYKTREKFHPVFAPWHALAALPQKDFAVQAGVLYNELVAVQDPRQRVNPLVLQALAGPPPASMREVAQRYGKLFTDIDRAWREAVQTAATNRTAVPTGLDPNREPLRRILYGADSPAAVPPGAMVDLEWFFDEGGREQLAKLHAEIDRWLIKATGAPPHAVILADRAAPRNARVLLRGNPANKGAEVPRQFLEVLSGETRQPFTDGSGRLELARAIASRDNPLTARVMVNRVWLHHFGAGLVRTPSDFGTRCEPPTHPELLDWLARRFMDDGWSLKKLHRLVMLSSAYQQSGAENPKALLADAENRLLWQFNRRRLDFEAMRDSLLAASGELDGRMGGKGAELFKPPFSVRRTVYGYIDRQFLPGAFRVFDFASPDLHTPQRSDTTVPQQALFFMNSPFVVERARSLANRPEVRAVAKPRERMQRLYEIVYQRPATTGQLEAGLRFLQGLEAEPPPELPKPIISAWHYGFGEYDESAKRVRNYQPLPHFTGEAWQGGANWPDSKLGWAQLTAEGGHAGNDLQHAAVRRWIAPVDATVTITGTIRHEHKEGDGIRARIVSSRGGSLGSWTLHNQKQEVALESVTVKAGDTIDFVVDFGGGLNSDMFKWAPVIRVSGAAVVSADSGYAEEWNAKKEFAGTPSVPIPPLNGWEKYAQVLLLSNEFMFVD